MARLRFLALLGLLGSAVAHAAAPTAEELLEATDDVARGESSRAVLSMQVNTENYDRAMKLESWSEGTDKSLIRILEPAKDAGVATLKVGDNIWNYMPRIDRTMKVPAGMMGGSWMGSHFTNDDLVKESRMAEDFTYEITVAPDDPEDPTGVYEITCTPKPDAPVVWGKVVVEVRADRIPISIQYYDEKGNLARTMRFEDVREFDGRKVPAAMVLQPADKPEESTTVRYESIDFDAEIPSHTFTLQALK